MRYLNESIKITLVCLIGVCLTNCNSGSNNNSLNNSVQQSSIRSQHKLIKDNGVLTMHTAYNPVTQELARTDAGSFQTSPSGGIAWGDPCPFKAGFTPFRFIVAANGKMYILSLDGQIATRDVPRAPGECGKITYTYSASEGDHVLAFATNGTNFVMVDIHGTLITFNLATPGSSQAFHGMGVTFSDVVFLPNPDGIAPGYYAVGARAAGGVSYYFSADGYTWEDLDDDDDFEIPPNQIPVMSYIGPEAKHSPNLFLIGSIASPASELGTYKISSNFKDWQNITLTTTQSLIGFAGGNGVYMAAFDGGDVFTSINGTLWTKQATLNNNFIPQDVVFAGDEFSIDGYTSNSINNNSNTATSFVSQTGNVWTNTDIPRFSYMKAGANSVCALESATTRSVFCWGDNTNGQLGFGSYGGLIPLPKPTALSNLVSAQLTVGESHACALTIDGHFNSGAYCWGSNSSGELGNGTYTSSNTPGQITLNPLMGTLVRIYSGNSFNCVIDNKGHTWCWGSNAYGQLGIDPGSQPNSSTAVPIKKFIAYTSADRFALGSNHACAINAQNQMLYCWGNNASGQLGVGESITYAVYPTLVKLNSSAIQVAKVYAGGDNTCAIAVDGTGYCWGKNNSGQVGNGHISDKVSTPFLIMGNFKYQELHPNSLHTCGITTQDVGLCWGDNTYGELGEGKTSSLPQDTPYIITGENKWSNMTTGYGFTCATDLYERRNYCWGKNDLGAVGINSLDPIEVNPLSINSY